MTSRRITGKDAISSSIATLRRTERHKYAGWLVLNVGIKKRGSNRAYLGALSETALSFLGWGLLRFSISTCLPCRFRSFPYEWDPYGWPLLLTVFQLLCTLAQCNIPLRFCITLSGFIGKYSPVKAHLTPWASRFLLSVFHCRERGAGYYNPAPRSAVSFSAA